MDLEPDDRENSRPFSRFGGGHCGILTPRVGADAADSDAGGGSYNASVTSWIEASVGGLAIFRPDDEPAGVLAAFSGRGSAPADETSPTAYLARRFASALSLDGVPILRAKQVHGDRAVTIHDAPPRGEVVDVGECDVLATLEPGVALAVQSADCVPILLAGRRAIAAAHAGWRGTARGAALAAIRALRDLGESPSELRAWLGPSIGSCCYEVGGEVAAQFAGDFVRAACDGPFRLDLRAANRSQLERAGLRADQIASHPACTKCGGPKFASYRRDGVKAGRMIALIVRPD